MRARPWLVVIALIAVHLLLRVTLGLEDPAPDLLLVAVLAASRHQRPGFAALLGMVAGLIDDSFAMRSFGASMVALSATGAMGSYSSYLFVGQSWHFPLLYFGIGKVVRDLLGWVLSDPFVRPPFAEPMVLDLLLAGVNAAVAGILVSLLFLSARHQATQ